MKKFRLFILILTAFIFSFTAVLCGCAPSGATTDKSLCRVVLSESDRYSCAENVQTIGRGGDAVFSIAFENGFKFGGASCKNYRVEETGVDGSGRRHINLILNNVKYSEFVTVDAAETAKLYNVRICESGYFRCAEPAAVAQEGTDAVFTLYFKEGYTFGGVDYNGGYSVSGADGMTDENRERRVVLTIGNVTRDTAVSVTAAEFRGEEEIVLTPVAGCAVAGYALNGGKFRDGGDGGSYFTVNYPLLNHPRPNTADGSGIYRDGYTLTGWNTEADGSGTHIGLGSRADVRKGQTLLLYAEWAEWTDPKLFGYVLIDVSDIPRLERTTHDKLTMLAELAEKCCSDERAAVITAFRGGAAQTLVIPSDLGGYPVAVVAAEAIKDSGGMKKLVLPETLVYVMGGAFKGSSGLEEIYLYDSLRLFDGKALESCAALRTLHINANTPPICGKMENGQFANKIEMLINSAEKPKTVLFGSCSLWYGVNAVEFGERTGRAAYNMGLMGGTCARFQLDLIRMYMNSGDTLIHLTELGSPYQMMYDCGLDSRVFATLENNYDLVARLDMRRYANVAAALSDYLFTKSESIKDGASGSYDDRAEFMSGYGDMIKERGGDYDNRGQTYDVLTVYDLTVNGAFGRIAEYVSEFSVAGVDVYYGFGPLNGDSVDADVIESVNEEFEARFGSGEISATLISDVYSSLLPAGYFYDTNYHLSTEGAKYFTDILVSNFLKSERK